MGDQADHVVVRLSSDRQLSHNLPLMRGFVDRTAAMEARTCCRVDRPLFLCRRAQLTVILVITDNDKTGGPVGERDRPRVRRHARPHGADYLVAMQASVRRWRSMAVGCDGRPGGQRRRWRAERQHHDLRRYGARWTTRHSARSGDPIAVGCVSTPAATRDFRFVSAARSAESGQPVDAPSPWSG